MTPEQEKMFAFRLRLEQEQSAIPDVSKTESFVRGGAQGLSMGFADELEAGVRSAIGPEKYEILRESIRSKYKTAEEANPMSYTGGMVAGAAAPAIAATLGTGGAAGPAAGGALARIAAPSTIRGMAAMGAAQGLGSSEADLTKGDVLGAAKDTATGGAVGGAFGVASKALPALAKLAPGAIRVGSETAAIRGIGLRGMPLEKMGVSGGRKIAATALEPQMALGGKPIMGAISDTEKMLQKASLVNESSGQRIGTILKELDAAGVPGPNVGNMKGQLEQLMGELREAAPNLSAGAAKQYEMALADIANLGERPTFSQLGKLKKAIGDLTYKHGSALDSKGGLQDAYNVVRNELDQAVELGTAKIQKPALASSYMKAKNLYHDTNIMIESLNKKHIRETGNNWNSLTSLLTAGIGATIGSAVGGGLPGAAAGVASIKAAQLYGPQVIAAGSKNLANTLEKMVRTVPQKLGRFAQPLTEALKRGPQQLAVANFVMQQRDPEYRKMLEMQESENR